MQLYQFLNKNYKKSFFLITIAISILISCNNIDHDPSEVYNIDLAKNNQYEKFRNINLYFSLFHVSDYIANIVAANGEMAIRESSLYRFGVGQSVITPLTFWIGGRGFPIRHTVVVDIQTGTRVFLDDLIDINDELIYLFQTGNIMRGVGDEFTRTSGEVLSEHMASLTHEEIREILMQTTIDLKDVANNSFTITTTNTFYIAPGQLVISTHNAFSFWGELLIYVEDIKDFLKAPAW